MAMRSAAEILKQAEDEQMHRAESVAWSEKLRVAAEAPGIAGELRRAVRSARLWPEELARDTGIDRERLSAFLGDEGPLFLEEAECLAARLGLRLAPLSTAAGA